MNSLIFLSIVLSAVLQASWNFFAKKSKADKISLLAVGWFLFGISLLASLPWTVDFKELDGSWARYSLASGAIHAVYLTLLGWGYSVGDISVVYPIARGLGVLWTSLLAWAFGVHAFSTNGIVGVVAISLGVVLIGHKALRSSVQKKAFFIAIAISIVIACYSIIDSQGAKAVPLPLYLGVMNTLAALIVIPMLFRFSKIKVTSTIRQHKWEAFLIGLGGSLAYVVILWAYRSTSVSYVAALREISVVMAALLGFVFLNEEISKRKIIGIVLVTLGAIFLKWS